MLHPPSEAERNVRVFYQRRRPYIIIHNVYHVSKGIKAPILLRPILSVKVLVQVGAAKKKLIKIQSLMSLFLRSAIFTSS